MRRTGWTSGSPGALWAQEQHRPTGHPARPPETAPMNHLAAPDRYDGAMRYRRTGRSGLDLPLLSLGYWHNFGDDRSFESQRAIALRAFDLGITHHDLANNYGPPYGSAEINFSKADAAGPGAVPGRDGDLHQGKLGHVARPLRPGRRLPEVPAGVPGPVPEADGPGLRGHLLLAPAGRHHAARGDHGRPGHRGAAGQGALRRHLLVRRRAQPPGGGDPARPGHPAADPPAVVQHAQPLDRDGRAAGRGRRGGLRRHRVHRPGAGAAHRALPGRRARGFAGRQPAPRSTRAG